MKVVRRLRAEITTSGVPGRSEPYARLADGRTMPMGLNGRVAIAPGTSGWAEYVLGPSWGLWRFTPDEVGWINEMDGGAS